MGERPGRGWLGECVGLSDGGRGGEEFNVLIRDVEELSQCRDKYGLQFVYVEPLFSSNTVGDDHKVDQPFGWGEVGGVSRCFWGVVSGCKAHLRGAEGGEDFDVFVSEDVG